MKIRQTIRKTADLLQSLRFNLRYLPLRQALKLPILIHKGKILQSKGKIIIDAPRITYGMIQLGHHICSLYPDSGITWENHGGTVIFKGKTRIGNDTCISVGPKATLTFGDDFINAAAVKIVTYRSITFGQKTRIGWNALIMDTNFHPLYDIEKKQYKKTSGPIHIGDFNWIGTNSKVLHSVTTPPRCIFGMDSVVTRSSPMESYCIMGGSPLHILDRNVIRDYDHEFEEE